MLSAGVLALLISIALGEHWALPHAPKFWAAWGYLVVFFVVERVSPTLAATYAYVNPPVALLVGWRLGNESFSYNVLLGLPIVLIAVALHAWIQSRPVSLAKGAGGEGIPMVPAAQNVASD
jgi:drug/metabolite transporter (DMT)-like permease